MSENSHSPILEMSLKEVSGLRVSVRLPRVGSLRYPSSVEPRPAPAGCVVGIPPSCRPSTTQSPTRAPAPFSGSRLWCRIGAHRLALSPGPAAGWSAAGPAFGALHWVSNASYGDGGEQPTVVKVDVEMTPLRQGMKIDKGPLRVFHSPSLGGELRPGEGPKLALRRLPVAGCHDGSHVAGCGGGRRMPGSTTGGTQHPACLGRPWAEEE